MTRSQQGVLRVLRSLCGPAATVHMLCMVCGVQGHLVGSKLGLFLVPFPTGRPASLLPPLACLRGAGARLVEGNSLSASGNLSERLCYYQSFKMTAASFKNAYCCASSFRV